MLVEICLTKNRVLYFNVCMIVNKIKNRLILFLFKGTKRVKFGFKSNKLLIVRLDAIGDYVLFRNFMQVLKQHPIWGKYKFTLLGNKIFKELAEHFDSNYIDKFIWFDNDKTYKAFYKLRLLAIKLKLECFDVLIHPVHSREGYIDEFCYATGSKYLIASEGDLLHFKSEEQKKIYDKLYNRLIPALNNFNFEFLRNQYFFKNLCDSEQIVKTSIQFKKSCLLSDNCYNIMIVPGAGSGLRRWSPNNFANLIAQINNLYEQQLNIRFYVIGTKSDKERAAIIMEKSEANNVTDLTDRITLLEVVNLIGNANLVISNETSSVHIAAATNTSAICIANGNHFGRFYPYPPVISDCIQTIYPHNSPILQYNEYLQSIDKSTAPVGLNIDLIKPETILREVEKLLDSLPFKYNDSKVSSSYKG